MIGLPRSFRIALLISLLATPRLLATKTAPSNLYRQWRNDPPHDESFFPIASGCNRQPRRNNTSSARTRFGYQHHFHTLRVFRRAAENCD